MRIRSAKLYALGIPFRESFSHALKVRSGSDALVLRVESDDGVVGYGEAAPRPYVSGESVDSVLEHLPTVLWPALRGVDLPDADTPDILNRLQDAILDQRDDTVIAHNASRSACEVALLDCALRRAGRPLSDILPPIRKKVRYDGAIDSSTTQKAARLARVMKTARIAQIKVKVGLENDAERLAEIRRIMGPDKPIRVDANCAWSVEEAVEALAQLLLEAAVKRAGAAEAVAQEHLAEEAALGVHDGLGGLEGGVVDEAGAHHAGAEELVFGGGGGVDGDAASKPELLQRLAALGAQAAGQALDADLRPEGREALRVQHAGHQRDRR